MKRRNHLFLLFLVCLVAIAADIIYLMTVNRTKLVVTNTVNEQAEESTTEKDTQETQELGSKMKSPVLDRQMTADEETFCAGFHRYWVEQENSDYETIRKYLYYPLRLTGDALGEEQVYAVTELEELMELSFETEALYQQQITWTRELALTDETGRQEQVAVNGLDFLKYLELCGVSTDDSGEIYIKCSGREAADESEYPYGNTGGEITFTLSELRQQEEQQKAMLIFSADGEPLQETGGIVEGPVALAYFDANGKTQILGNLADIVLSTEQTCENPHYEQHNRAPHDESKDITFTINVYQKGVVNPQKSVLLTTEELEQLALENPQAVVGNYYGTIGDKNSMDSMGVDGWLDYFVGIDLGWLLREQAGVENFSGSAKFYGRDGNCYTSLEDISYLDTEAHARSDYYTLSRNRAFIYNSIPMLAFGKNGYPLMKEHEHSSAGYHAYNQLNQNLEDLGVSTEIGVIKNQSGPFVACLGNLEGYYGGYQIETGGDCVRMDVYLEGEQ